MTLLSVRNLSKSFSDGKLFGVRRRVLHEISLEVAAGEVVALVGESGSGKSTLARVLAGLERPDAGEIRLESRPLATSGLERARVQMVFQDPFSSLNPVHTVEHHLARPILRRRAATSAELHDRVIELLAAVGLDRGLAERHPHALSGGQRQRVAIARALAAKPEVVLADEPTSMLDVSTRLGVLDLLRWLADEKKLGVLLITHDLASAAAVADRVLTLYAGRVVESGPARKVLLEPAHPYTRLLLAAVPRGDRLGEGTLPLRDLSQPGGEAAAAPGEGCPFAPRCQYALEVCRHVPPSTRAIAPGHQVTCHLFPDKGAADHAALS